MFKSIFLLGLLVSNDGVSALEVTPGSSCSAICLKDTESDPLDPESSSTDISEITCNDDEYGSTSTGIKYKNCLDCLQRSNATQEAESDAIWFLYNIRYSVDVCVYGFPNASKRVSSPCDINTACGPLKKAMVAGNLDPDRDPYEYCTADGDRFSGHVLDACIQCMTSSESQYFMSNFMTALQAGCEQRPTGGDLLGLSSTLFTDSRLEITDPPSNETLVGPEGSSGTMSQGTIVGIAVGAALLFLGGTALFWAYHRKQKRLYGEPIGSDYDPRGSGGGGDGSKSVTPPLVGGYNHNNYGGGGSGGKSIVQMSEYEMRSQRKSSYYATNAEYYAALALEKETTMAHQRQSHYFAAPPRQPEYAYDPTNPGAMPTHFAYDPRTTQSRQSSRYSHSHSQASTPEPRLRPAPATTRAADNNKKPPDSYALHAYLSAAEDANMLLPGPPPGLPPPPAAVVASSRGPSPSGGRASASSSLSHGRAASLTQTQIQQQTMHCSEPAPSPPPPPPPPAAATVPALSLPSVPRIRVPKKYAPPRITVEGATPVDAPSEQQH